MHFFLPVSIEPNTKVREPVEDSLATMEEKMTKAFTRIENRLESLETLPAANFTLVGL